MLGTTKQGEVLHVIVGLLEQVQAILQAQDAANGIVDAAHGHFALLYQLLQQGAETPVVGVHGHIDARIDGQLDGFLLILGYVVALPQVVYIGPVGHNHAVPVEVFLQPLRQQAVVGVEGQSVVHGRVNHDGERTVAHHFEVGCKVLLAQVLFGDGRRRTVLARHGYAVAQKVLHAGSHIVRTDVVGVIALETENRFASHLGIEIAVLTIVLPHTRPARVTT